MYLIARCLMEGAVLKVPSFERSRSAYLDCKKGSNLCQRVDVSSGDKALTLSQFLYGSLVRLGRLDVALLTKEAAAKAARLGYLIDFIEGEGYARLSGAQLLHLRPEGELGPDRADPLRAQARRAGPAARRDPARRQPRWGEHVHIGGLGLRMCGRLVQPLFEVPQGLGWHRCGSLVPPLPSTRSIVSHRHFDEALPPSSITGMVDAIS
jgi:Alpha/beta hydrolase of unknown function (DUF900)